MCASPGVKVATQTPPVKSGQRVIFLSLDDATGVSDATFFERVHDRCAWTVFHTWLLVVDGTVHRTGARGVSIKADAAFDLRRLMVAWREGWLPEALAEQRRLPAAGPPDPFGPDGAAPAPQPAGTAAATHHHPLYDALHLDEMRSRGAGQSPASRLRVPRNAPYGVGGQGSADPGRSSRVGPNGTTWADPARRHPGVDPGDLYRLPPGHPLHPDTVDAPDEGRPSPPRRRRPPPDEPSGDGKGRKLWHSSQGSAGR